MIEQSADIPRLLDALGIQGRPHGDELWAPCPHPDHPETRPSWSIRNDPNSPNNGAHFCFGCQFTGGPVDLVQAVIGISWGGARQWITDHGLWLKGSLPLAVRFEVLNRYATGLKLPGGLIEGPLHRWITPARRYVASRGITEEQREKWEICYAVDGSMGGRVVFPLKDESLRWLSWHARTYCGQDKRYKNAAREDGYDPGAIFGMRWWPPVEARQKASVVLTEGTIDALACERAGAQYVAAIGGSEAHARQLLKLQTWGRMLVATDGDVAGESVYTRLRSSLGARRDVCRVAIPAGTDAGQLGETAYGMEELRSLLCLVDAKADPSRALQRNVRSRSKRRRLKIDLRGS